MSMTKCRECGTEVSTKAEACPNCGAKFKSKSGCGTLVIAGVLVIIALAAIGQCSSNTSPTTAATASHATTTPNTAPLAAQPAASVPAIKPQVGSQWNYKQERDPMGKGTAYYAWVLSTNTVDFGFPYSGPQHGTLTLRTHPRYGKSVILHIERGQFLCTSFEDCTVLVRFDDGKASRYSAIGAADNSTETIFIRGYSRFLGHMEKSKRVRISANVYQEGAPVFEFDVTGFDAGSYKPGK